MTSNSFEADGYRFTYTYDQKRQSSCDVTGCRALGVIEVTRIAGGEVQTYCVHHARKYFPYNAKKIHGLSPSKINDYVPDDAASRIFSQRRTDPVYDKEDDPFEGDAILEARVVRHLAGKHGKQVLTRVLKKMVNQSPGMAAKYLYQFMPPEQLLGRFIEKMSFENLRKK